MNIASYHKNGYKFHLGYASHVFSILACSDLELLVFSSNSGKDEMDI